MATITDDGRPVQGGPALPVYGVGGFGGDGGAVDVGSLPAYATNANGELQGVTSATRLPDVACDLVVFKARLSNTGNVYLGGAGVGIPNNVTDVSSGLELAPGDFLTLPIANLNQLYRICDNATDGLTYLVLA